MSWRCTRRRSRSVSMHSRPRPGSDQGLMGEVDNVVVQEASRAAARRCSTVSGPVSVVVSSAWSMGRRGLECPRRGPPGAARCGGRFRPEAGSAGGRGGGGVGDGAVEAAGRFVSLDRQCPSASTATGFPQGMGHQGQRAGLVCDLLDDPGGQFRFKDQAVRGGGLDDGFPEFSTLAIGQTRSAGVPQNTGQSRCSRHRP